MNKRALRTPVLVFGLLVLGLAAAFYGRRHLKSAGFFLPKTPIAQRKLYEGAPATMASVVEDWPKWRGPRGDQISREALPDKWPDGGPQTLWAADVGIGYSSPIVTGGRVYLFSLSNSKETLTAFDANSGKIV